MKPIVIPVVIPSLMWLAVTLAFVASAGAAAAPALADSVQRVVVPGAGTPDIISGAGAPTVTIPRCETGARVDGNLDEPVWRQAARLGGFSQFQPVDGRPAEEQTEVRVWYAPDAIWFGVVARDREPGAIRATHADRDNIDSDDRVVIYLDTFDDRRRAFFFAVNPLGVQQDGMYSEGVTSAGNIFGGSEDRNPDYWFESRGRVTADGYVVEVRIPFKSLRYPGNGPQRWGINLLRRVQRTGYQDTWTDVRRASASFLMQSGRLDGLHDLQRGLVTELQPFVTGTANGAYEPVPRQFQRQKTDGEAGLNLRVSSTSLSLDGTFNPDFSQVESDASQVTANERFALFYPEKRPFFLEGIELFSTPNQLVYTRRMVEPHVGAKLTGKVGPVGLAHLTVFEQDDPRDVFDITRLRRDFGSNSTAGVTFTTHGFGADDYNRVLAGDMRLVFAKLYFVEAQLGGAWTRPAGAPAGAARTSRARIWHLAYDRTGRSWGFNYLVNGIGPDFESDAGYVPRNDVVYAHAFNRLTWYGARGALLENFTVVLEPSRYWRYGELDRRSIEGEESAEIKLRLRGGWELEARPAREFVRLDAGDYEAYSVRSGDSTLAFRPLDEVSGSAFSISASTPTYRAFDAGVELFRGRSAIFPEAAAGTVSGLEAGLALRPTQGIRVTGTAVYERLARRRDGSEFARTFIPRLKVEYQPMRALFFRLVGEYRSERQAALADAHGAPLLVDGQPQPASNHSGLRVDGLASYEPRPGTVAFFGYGSSHEADGSVRLSELRHTSDGFFLKLAYQFRR